MYSIYYYIFIIIVRTVMGSYRIIRKHNNIRKITLGPIKKDLKKKKIYFVVINQQLSVQIFKFYLIPSFT